MSTTTKKATKKATSKAKKEEVLLEEIEEEVLEEVTPEEDEKSAKKATKKAKDAKEDAEEAPEADVEAEKAGDATVETLEGEMAEKMAESAFERMLAMQKAGSKKGELVEATGKEFAAMFNQDVLPLDDTVKYKTVADEHKDAVAELKSAYMMKRPLTGRIVGLSQSAAGSLGDVYSAVVMYGPFRVLIPLPYLLELDPAVRSSERMRDKDYLRLLINERIGSEIDFVPLEPNEKEMIAGGDRLLAMQIKRQAFFLQKKRGRYLLHEGDVVEARVCYTTRATLHLEVYGIELTLKREDVTYKHISSIRDMYMAGDRLPVKITRLVRTEQEGEGNKTYKIHLEVSAKEAEYDPRPNYLKHMNPGDVLQGTIAVTTNTGFFVKVLGMDMDIYCGAPKDFSQLPINGDEVLISIAAKDMDKLEAYGRIVRILGRRTN